MSSSKHEIKPLRKLFISNRGEIAERITRCCERLGLPCVTAHIPSEEGRPYVVRSVHSVLVSPTDFLSPDAMVRAAVCFSLSFLQNPSSSSSSSFFILICFIFEKVESGCDSLHPGYGFLSESADFAEAVQKAGLVWVGPDPGSIRAMGDKIHAKNLIASSPMARELVPLIPGYFIIISHSISLFFC